MKKASILLFVVALTVLALALASCSPGDNSGLKYEPNEDGQSYSVSGVSESFKEAELVIPSEYKGKPVTGIGDTAFAKCTDLKSVVIPDGIKSIGNYAFNECVGLVSVTIPDSVTDIGSGAFNNCMGLISVKLGSGLTSIGNKAFCYCIGLTMLEIPAGVTSIGTEAFTGCNGLYIVNNKSSLNLTIGSEDNGKVAFFAKVILNADGSVTGNGDGYVYVLEKNEFLFRLDEESNKYSLIAYTGGNETVTLPGSIKGSSYEIYELRGVRNVIIPDGVTSLGYGAFYGCASMVSLTIPSSVTIIGKSALAGCTQLTSISFGGTKAQWEAIEKGDKWGPSSLYNCIAHCTDGDITIEH